MQEKYVDSTFAKIYYKESFRLLVFTAEDKPPNHPPPPPPPPPPHPLLWNSCFQKYFSMLAAAQH